VTKKTAGGHSKLDWSRLLGFDQACGSSAPAGDRKAHRVRLARVGVKVGAKPGVKNRPA
jgi:hypothetical protein